MTNGSDDPDQFLVAARSGAAANDLTDFERALQAIPGASVLKRAGRPDQPRLVVALPANGRDDLIRRFGTTLIIEKNAKLDPL
jgi:hypothetical protein